MAATCQYLIDGHCRVSSRLAGIPCVVETPTCNACERQAVPRAENKVTRGLAAASLYKAGLLEQSRTVFQAAMSVELAAQQVVLQAASTVGNNMKELLAQKGVEVAQCECQEWIDRMNLWGPDGCRENMGKIVDHLFAEATTNKATPRLIRLALNVPFVGEIVGRQHLTALVEQAIQMELDKSKPPDDASSEHGANVVEYHRALAQRVARQVQNSQPPDDIFGRAILIPAGGGCTVAHNKTVPYFWLAYTAAYILRRTGCLLPIEFWFLPGEMQAIDRCEEFATSVGAVCKVLDTTHMRVVHGWQVKINAILQTKYKEVLHLDADNIVRNDPTYLFDSPEFEATGALFWPDDFSTVTMVTNRMLNRLGLPENGPHRDFESGQILINKSRCWPGLLLTKHFADHADYWGGKNGEWSASSAVWYGDKTDFWAAWRMTGCGSFHNKRPVFPFNRGGFFEHHDPQGRIVFQHVTRAKESLYLGRPIIELPNGGCCMESVELRCVIPWLLPGDIVGAAETISPEQHFKLWDDNQTRGVWLNILRRNEYQLPDRFAADDLVVDIGAQTGAFSFACAVRGATVVSYEPYEPSCRRAVANTQRFPRVKIINHAVVRSDRPAADVVLCDPSGGYQPGTFTTQPVAGPVNAQWTVKAEGIDEVLRAAGKVRLLKLDCEGSEYQILYTSRELNRVQEICGESHDYQKGTGMHDPPSGGWPGAWTAEGLKVFLSSRGFDVTTERSGNSHVGFFRARRN